MRAIIRTLFRFAAGLVVLILVLLLGPLYVVVSGQADVTSGWYERSRESAGIAPAPRAHPGAVVQVYAARAYGWRGAFSVHTWIALKERDADFYRVLDVNAWRLYRRGSSLRVYRAPPDRKWFGSTPVLLADVRGSGAEPLIRRILEVAEDYPHNDAYAVWPGPNSNTFVAHVGRHVPELGLRMPPHAIGKDYLDGRWWARTPSGSGWQLSLGGYLGLLVSRSEGLEFNLLGLNFGVNPLRLALRLPGIGSLGPLG